MTVEPDSVSSWIVAITGSVLLTSSMWVYRCSSILFIGIYEEFGGSREQAAWPLAAFSASSCLVGPLVGMLSRRFRIPTLLFLAACFNSIALILSSFATDLWQLTLTLGIILGCSAGIPITLSGVLVTQYFSKYRTAAMGVHTAGPSILAIVVPSIMQFCLEEYKLSGTLLIFSVLCMQGIPASLLLCIIGRARTSLPTTSETAAVKVPLMEKSSRNRVYIDPSGNEIPKMVLRQLSENRVRRDTPRLSDDDGAPPSPILRHSLQRAVEKEKSVFKIFEERWFYIVAFSHITFMMVFPTLLNLMEDFGRDKNLNLVLARNLVGILSATDLLARLGSPWITDGGFISREHLFMFNYAMMAVGLILLGLAEDWTILICIIAFLGWIFGSTVVLFIDIMREKLGMQNIAFANGWYLFFGGLFGLTRPKAIGYFRESHGSYNPIMYISAAMAASAALVYITGYILGGKRSVSDPDIVQGVPEEEMDMRRIRSASFTPSLSSM